MDTNSSTTPTSRDDLRGLDRDIEALNTVLIMLKRRRDLMRLEQSPMQHLPDDILEEIFVNCLPTTRNARPFVSESPLLLTVVCRKWRAVALSAPRLWSTLHISTSFNFNPKKGPTRNLLICSIDPQPLPKDRLLELHTARIAGLDQWLCRSGALPLFISLHSPNAHSHAADVEIGETDAFERKTLDVVARCAHRIRGLEVNILMGAIIQLCESISQHSPCSPSKLPLLQYLRLKYFTRNTIGMPLHGDDEESLSVLSLLYGSESLREVAISPPLTPRMRNYWMELPVNITVLTLYDPIEVSSLHHVLRKLQRLEQAYFRPHSQPWDVVDDHIFLPSLKTLSVYASKGSLDLFCRPLKAPNLSSLCLQVQMHYDPSANIQGPLLGNTIFGNVVHIPPPPVNHSIEHVCNFLTHCTSLQTLTINKHALSGAEMDSILSRLSPVKSLIFSGCADRQPSLRFYGKRSDFRTISTVREHCLHPLLKQETVSEITGDAIPLAEPLLPQLTTFTWNPDLPDIPIDFVIEFVISRLHRHHDAVSTEEASRMDSGSRRCTTASLKEINIKLFESAARAKVEDAIIRHAELNDLKRGVDFNLDVSGYPYVEECIKPVPQYFIPVGSKSSLFTDDFEKTADGLLVENDVTWPLVDMGKIVGCT